MPDRKQDRTGARPEFEVAYYTKELGQSLQRQMLRKQLARFTRSGAGADPDAAEAGSPVERPPADPDSTP